jgi:hypothetical protein
MIKKFFTVSFLPLFFIAVAFTSGCSAPIGGLEVDNTRDYIRAAPRKFLYAKDTLFKVEDVDVIGVFGGRERLIEINEVKIAITPPFSRDPVPVDKEKGLPLENKGVNTVVISYLDMVTDYPIQVAAPGDVLGWDGDGEISIIIYWPRPKPTK